MTTEQLNARAQAAAAARWGERGTGARIRIDTDAAAMLAELPEDIRRTVASDAIRDAVARCRAMDGAIAAYKNATR